MGEHSRPRLRHRIYRLWDRVDRATDGTWFDATIVVLVAVGGVALALLCWNSLEEMFGGAS